jgi:glycerol-3-phosphate acyltransferase PlsY
VVRVSYLPTTVILAVAAYLIGSVLFAVIASRVFRLPDPRTYGSGNPGTANVLRSGNRVATVLTLVGDTLKGWFAVWLARVCGQDAMEWGDGRQALWS